MCKLKRLSNFFFPLVPDALKVAILLDITNGLATFNLSPFIHVSHYSTAAFYYDCTLPDYLSKIIAF